MEHESGAKADGAPRRQVPIDLLRVLLERCTRPVQSPVVMKVVDAYFETSLREECAELFRGCILAFRHEIERRAETQARLYLGQPMASVQSGRAFDVVRQDERELLAVGPSRPPFRAASRCLVNGPGVSEPRPQSPGVQAANRAANPQRDRTLQPEIDARQGDTCAVGIQSVYGRRIDYPVAGKPGDQD